MGTEFDQDAAVQDMLLKENMALKTWVRGLLAGCEGCTADATAWAVALDSGANAVETEAEHEEHAS